MLTEAQRIAQSNYIKAHSALIGAYRSPYTTYQKMEEVEKELNKAREVYYLEFPKERPN